MKTSTTPKHTTNPSQTRPKRGRFWGRSAAVIPAIIFAAAVICLPAALHTGQSVLQTKTTAGQLAETLPADHGPIHDNIVTTVFWVGEAADSANDYISNVPSAWDEDWQTSYGGYDDPTHRNGHNPAKFTARENPFYFALPYSDLTEQGVRKEDSSGCLPYAAHTNDSHSWCKNAWIAIHYGGKTAYAQWEDVGPNETDDSAYVFGTAKPKNTFGERAGLDVSPAVRDYLRLDGSDSTSWAFVPASAVPDGPWKARVTTSLGYELN